MSRPLQYAAGALCALLLATSAVAQVRCVVEGPDSVRFDTILYNRYLPASFDIDVLVVNDGTGPADSVVVFPRSNPRFTILSPPAVLASSRLAPGDTARAVFTLTVNPRETSGVDTVAVAISAKAGVRGECRLPIWVEKEYRPVNVIECPADTLRLAFVDSLDAYIPDPLPLTLRVRNTGDAPSRATQLFYVATPGVAPATGQDPLVALGDLAAGEYMDRVFLITPVRRANDTIVAVRFRVQGIGGLGDRIVDTLCTAYIFIPAARDPVFRLDCRNDIVLTERDGVYDPNPFLWRVAVRNLGTARARDVRAVLTLPPGVRLEGSQDATVTLGTLDPSADAQAQWMLRALPAQRSDTLAICVRVYDAFNREAVCCDTLRRPAVRVPVLEATCSIVPDSVFFDPGAGRYQPARIPLVIDVGNTGASPAEDVDVQIIVSDPGIALSDVPQRRLTAALAPSSFERAEWELIPSPAPVPRSVTVLARITARNAEERTAVCMVFIDAAPSPQLACTIAIDPPDTLHYDPATLEYLPLRVSTEVRNIGAAPGRRLEALILLPAGIGLVSGDSAVRRASSDPLAPGETWQTSWTLRPIARRDGRRDTVRVEFRIDGQRVECGTSLFIVGIPPLTVLSIPTGEVARTDRSVAVPIRIDNSTGKDIRRLEVIVGWDPALLSLEDLIPSSTLLHPSWTVTRDLGSDRLRLLAETTDTTLAGEGDLATMLFRVVFGRGDDALRWRWADLRFDTVLTRFNRGGVLVRFTHGAVMTSGECLVPLRAGAGYVIMRASPNPFNPSTVISLSLVHPEHLRLRLLDLLGREVAVVADREFTPGDHQISIGAEGLPSGVYLCVAEREAAPPVILRLVIQR